MVPDSIMLPLVYKRISTDFIAFIRVQELEPAVLDLISSVSWFAESKTVNLLPKNVFLSDRLLTIFLAFFTNDDLKSVLY